MSSLRVWICLLAGMGKGLHADVGEASLSTRFVYYVCAMK